MANKFSPMADDWMVVDKSGEAWRRITMLSAAVAVSAVLWIFLGSLLLAVGTRDAAAGRDLAHEFGKLPPPFVAPDDTLIVWAGDQAPVSPDFVAVIDFNQHSPTGVPERDSRPIRPPADWPGAFSRTEVVR